MFTGIIETIGIVKAIERTAKGYRLKIEAPSLLDDLKLGDSVATNGVCLTASEILTTGFVADIMPQTLEMTSLSRLSSGSKVNLERALQLSSRLGGHLVSGHVDGQAYLKDISADGNAFLYKFTASSKLLEYLVPQGSIAIQGVSLTIASLDDYAFTVSLIPHTLKETVLGALRLGDPVNIETDLMGKYVLQFMNRGGNSKCLSSAALTAFLMD